MIKYKCNLTGIGLLQLAGYSKAKKSQSLVNLQIRPLLGRQSQANLLHGCFPARGAQINLGSTVRLIRKQSPEFGARRSYRWEKNRKHCKVPQFSSRSALGIALK